mmetsp:Transcript_49402/g.55196  ORF Transcript_49402/g.55196 Transcript_49402/m.55196 type:complete len:116 (-) Transcript_49402:2-349(-)
MRHYFSTTRLVFVNSSAMSSILALTIMFLQLLLIYQTSINALLLRTRISFSTTTLSCYQQNENEVVSSVVYNTVAATMKDEQVVLPNGTKARVILSIPLSLLSSSSSSTWSYIDF